MKESDSLKQGPGNGASGDDGGKGPLDEESFANAIESLVDKVFSDGSEERISVKTLASVFNQFVDEPVLEFYDMDGQRVEKWTEDNLVAFASNFFDPDSMQSVLEFEPRRVDWNLEKELREKVFDRSLFEVSFGEEALQPAGARLFAGEMKADSDAVYRDLRSRMDQHFPELAVFLLEDNDGYSWVSVAYKDSLIRWLPNLTLFQIAAFLATLLFLNQLLYNDPSLVSGVSYALNSATFQFGFVAAFLSAVAGETLCSLAYGLPIPTRIFPFLSPGFGTIGMCVRHSKLHPTRASAMDLALSNSLASLAASTALLLAPPIQFNSAELLPLNEFGFSQAAPGASPLSGVVLVPVDILSHSAVLSDLALLLSSAVLPDVQGGSEVMAIRPLALAGLLGLNFTAFNLLPAPSLNGGRIFFNIFGSDLVAVLAGLLSLPLMAFLSFQWIWFFFLLNVLLSLALFDDTQPLNAQRNPDLVRSALGLGLLAAAFCTLLPPKVFGPVSHAIFTFFA